MDGIYSMCFISYKLEAYWPSITCMELDQVDFTVEDRPKGNLCLW